MRQIQFFMFVFLVVWSTHAFHVSDVYPAESEFNGSVTGDQPGAYILSITNSLELGNTTLISDRHRPSVVWGYVSELSDYETKEYYDNCSCCYTVVRRTFGSPADVEKAVLTFDLLNTTLTKRVDLITFEEVTSGNDTYNVTHLRYVVPIPFNTTELDTDPMFTGRQQPMINITLTVVFNVSYSEEKTTFFPLANGSCGYNVSVEEGVTEYNVSDWRLIIVNNHPVEQFLLSPPLKEHSLVHPCIDAVVFTNRYLSNISYSLNGERLFTLRIYNHTVNEDEYGLLHVRVNGSDHQPVIDDPSNVSVMYSINKSFIYPYELVHGNRSFIRTYRIRFDLTNVSPGKNVLVTEYCDVFGDCFRNESIVFWRIPTRFTEVHTNRTSSGKQVVFCISDRSGNPVYPATVILRMDNVTKTVQLDGRGCGTVDLPDNVHRVEIEYPGDDRHRPCVKQILLYSRRTPVLQSSVLLTFLVLFIGVHYASTGNVFPFGLFQWLMRLIKR